MKYSRLYILLFLTFILVSSCGFQRKVVKNNDYNESYTQYLSSVINDTVFFRFSELSIVDKSINPILDSVIALSEKCKYFDNRVKYLNSFRFGMRSENGKNFYSITAHLSPAQAIGLILVETGIIKQIAGGIFYYKNYLFVIPADKISENGELKYFPFLKMTDKILKIRAPKFLDERVYSSYITFSKSNGEYKIIENEICGPQILIE